MRKEQGFMAKEVAAPILCIKKAVKSEPSRSTKEVAEIFGVARTTIIMRVRRGIFPKPDFVVNYERSRPTYYWRVSTLLAEAKRRGLKIEV
jgi:hypothetical protein